MDIEGVARAKRELVESLPAEGIAVLNADDGRVAQFAHRLIPSLSASIMPADVRADDVVFTGTGGRFSVDGTML